MSNLIKEIREELSIDTLAPRTFHQILQVINEADLGYREINLMVQWLGQYANMQYDEAGKFVQKLGQL